MMKVLIVVPGLPLNMDKIQGGVHSAVLNLLHGFAHIENVYVRLLSFTGETKHERVVQFNDHVEISHVPEGPLPFSSINYLLFSSFKLKQQVIAFNADIVHYEIGGSLLFTRLFGLNKRPYLLTFHGIPQEELKLRETFKEKLATYFNLYIGNWLQPSYIIHISDFSRKYVRTAGIKDDITIPNAISSKYFNIPDKKVMSNRLIFIGVINDRKNLMFMLQALKKMVDIGKPYTLDVCGGFGNQMYKQLVESFIAGNNLQDIVKFHGWVSQTDVIRMLAECDILVLTSKAETLPMAIAEAMAAGRFAIASDVGGIPDMIDDEKNGFLIDLDNSSQVIKLLESLYNNSALTSHIKTAARVTAQGKYDAAKVAKSTTEFYTRILNGTTE
ncbi:glycosyltransferase family 4 protein [Flavihumibacter fluvii]|uniref:glycosyltransferase family 4 protein n=1 Tax=Flavihumibacter fluvii TaxID=2838157 RepID=UPI001BDF1DDE|nr:glycosyltransferase family 4 protein [Flavihumibacter fluvii]ULQ54439.1 glycosyltransferase family 4 protein [Flavihumibacter fluvii]